MVKPGIIAVSRDCFPIALSQARRAAIVKAYGEGLYECPVTVENEKDALKAVEDVRAAGCNALVVFLGNFGPETPETLIAQHFDGPCMYVAAAEGDGDMINGRGDAYCGLLNCSYNLGMRHLSAYIPEVPRGHGGGDRPACIRDFLPIARAIIGVKNLKIITFGPRPQDFFACNAPIKGLYELGVEIEENSELDLLVAFKEHENDPRIDEVCARHGRRRWARAAYYEDLQPPHGAVRADASGLGRKPQGRAASTWPSPTSAGPPSPASSALSPATSTPAWPGAASPWPARWTSTARSASTSACASPDDAVTLLDINNTVPAYIYDEDIKGKYDYKLSDTFMGFHCGNTPECKLCASRAVKYQLIQHRLLEPDGSEPDFTRGTLEGDIAAGDITFYRLQCDSEGVLRAYVAQGEVLAVPTRSFGGIGVFAIPEMGRFYRHVLVGQALPAPRRGRLRAMWARRSLRCSSSWALRTSPTTGPRRCPIPRRIRLPD